MALQIIAKTNAEESEAAFDEFTANVIIYSNQYARRSKQTMIFNRDGSFANDFEAGFMDIQQILTNTLNYGTQP